MNDTEVARKGAAGIVDLEAQSRYVIRCSCGVRGDRCSGER